MQKAKYKVRAEITVTVLLLCVIWGHSMMPPQVSAAESGWIAGLLHRWIPWDGLPFFIRKLAHFTEFAALGTALFLCMRSFSGVCLQSAVNALFAGLCAAVTDEFIQLFSGRGSAVADVVLDFSGCLTGVLLIFICMYLRQKRRRSSKTSN